MARAFIATLPGPALPDRAVLQRAIDALGVNCKLDLDYAPDLLGYCACDLQGEDAGFSLKSAGEEQRVARNSWGGDPREEAAAAIFCAALATAFGARVERDGIEQTADELLKIAKNLL